MSLTAVEITTSSPAGLESNIVPTSVLGPAAGVIDGEPTSPVTEVGLVIVRAVPASTPKLAALARGRLPAAQLVTKGAAPMPGWPKILPSSPWLPHAATSAASTGAAS